ncbi:MAG: FliM/FliN family flagellar motor switch protein, partial [Planctomycetes bacterium]|nr:FliM/FliN family flagellar motor switch protein [Planctomycetota bacterium]
RSGQSLCLLCERFAEEFSSSASLLVGCDVRARAPRWGRLPYSDFLSSISEPACCCGVRITGPSKAPRQGWIEISPPAARAIIDAMFGVCPPGQAAPSDRPATLVEHKLLLRVMASAVECFSRAWSGEGLENLHLFEGPLDGAPAPAAASDEAVTVLTFELSLAGRFGQLRFCLPAGLIDGSDISRAPRRRTGPVEMSVAVSDTAVPRDELDRLEIGDIITTDTSVDGEVVVRVGGIPKYRARLGVCDGRRAVVITRGISDDPPTEPPQAPGGDRPEMS